MDSISEARYFAALVEGSLDAIIGKRLDGMITSWNPAAERLYGYPAHEVVGRSIQLLEPGERQGETKRLNARLARGEPVADFETVRARKDGSRVEVLLTISPIRDESGAVVGASTIAHDLSARRAAEADVRRLESELHQAQKMDAIGRLSGGIAHEFNNLLVAIRDYTDLPRRRASEEELAALEQIDAAARPASELTQQMLAFSPQRALHRESTDLNAVASETLALLRRSLGPRIEIEADLWADGAILVERSELVKVILNLAINVRDAMPDGGKLYVRTASLERDGDPHLVLEVTGIGVGMDAETRQRLFEPSFTRKKEGTGLGLTSVYSLVEQSGGHVSVFSQPGEGTTFELYFPRTEAPPPPALSLPFVDSLLGGEVILLVEDSGIVRTLVTATLESYGYEVLAAAGPSEAISLAEGFGRQIDLLLTDVVMPHMSGHELAERLAAVRPDLKVLFVSGYPADTTSRLGVAEPQASFIEKPYLPDGLARAVRGALDRS